jgi:hypothetical protein
MSARRCIAVVRLVLVLVVVSAGALVLAALAPSKEGARARLTTTLPLGAAPATTIRVGWTVRYPGNNGGRPFGANGMFVRLLSRTGAPSTVGFAPTGAYADGRYAAHVGVPEGGIGGVRLGLRGTTDLPFPVDNDPFASPGGVRCDVATFRAAVAAFVRAFNRGDLPRLDRLFSRRNFVWYSSTAPGTRLLPDASSRASLIPYFRRRHSRGDRLTLLTYRFNGYERARDLGHFELSGRRRADDFRQGSWFPIEGKGALDCSKRPVTIAVMSLGAAG